MYLIFKRKNNYGFSIFYSLDDIKKAVQTEFYGKYKYDEKTKTELKNDYDDFTIIKNPVFPYEISNNYLGMKNIIFDVNEEENYYLLDEHHYAHGVWDYPSMDGKKLIFNNLIEIKKYCENVVNKTQYMDYYSDNRYICENESRIEDLELIKKKFEENEFDKNIIDFTIGNDYFCVFTISKIN